jgi:Na+/melibiose symporter-like transporter
MNKQSTKESGFATIFVLMLAVALFILLGFALKSMYSVHKQNRKDKRKIIKKVEELNQKSKKEETVHEQGVLRKN